MILRKHIIVMIVAFIVVSTTGHIWIAHGKTLTVAPIKNIQIKVGITEYAKIQRTYHNYERLFRELAASTDANESVKFQFAVGTYGEVRDWFNKGLIDIAILSAMPVGDLLLAHESDNLNRAYIGDLSVSSAPTSQSLLNLFPNEKPDPFYYRAKCIFSLADKKLVSVAKAKDPFAELKKLWDDGQLRFLFVRPYSLSGYIAPIIMLKDHKIEPIEVQKDPLEDQKKRMVFTYDHQESLNQLVVPDSKIPAMHQVAFVYAEAQYPEENADVRQLFGSIETSLDDDSYKIPREIVLANYHQERDEEVGSENKFTRNKALMVRLFNKWVANVKAHRFVRSEDEPRLLFQTRAGWQNDYTKVRQLLEGFSLPKELLYKARLDDLLNDVIDANPSRLALVLSGGGAKCAYQAGAIVEIEKQLDAKLKAKQQELQKKWNGKSQKALQKELDKLPKKLQIDLVVGTSGGAINALLAAMEVTKHPNASEALREAWKSFKQRQFLQPSVIFSRWFGFCFAVLQALLVTVAVLLFGRQSMNWLATMIILFIFVIIQYPIAYYFDYFGFARRTIIWLLLYEFIAILSIALLVFIVAEVISQMKRRQSPKTKKVNRIELNPPTELVEDPNYCCLAEESVARKDKRLLLNQPAKRGEDPDHWRKLTIVLLLFLCLLETLVALIPGVEDLEQYLPDTHWVEHIWTAVILISKWSYPFPLLISLLMMFLGWKRLPLRLRPKWIRGFDWIGWRGRWVTWTSVFLVFICVILLLEGFFKEPSPSEVEGIELAFLDNVPMLIKKTIKEDFSYSSSPGDKTKQKLESISRQIIAEGLLKRDLVITSSKLPVTETTVSLPVNNLPDDLYFYFRSNDDVRLKPPPDKSFVPLKHNKDNLVDVVIGSSTIYPVFPARTLKNIYVGNEDTQGALIPEMRIIDGGFIHNIPIEAAILWGATHIIVIEASPGRQQRDPQVFWDHALNAFGYLFSQAQQTDALGPNAEAFVLRPTSKCEKFNSKSVCTEKDGAPQPDMDTFDFSKRAADRAFTRGAEDVDSSQPLFVKIPGSPNFQDVSSSAIPTPPHRRR